MKQRDGELSCQTSYIEASATVLYKNTVITTKCLWSVLGIRRSYGIFIFTIRIDFLFSFLFRLLVLFYEWFGGYSLRKQRTFILPLDFVHLQVYSQVRVPQLLLFVYVCLFVFHMFLCTCFFFDSRFSWLFCLFVWIYLVRLCYIVNALVICLSLQCNFCQRELIKLETWH